MYLFGVLDQNDVLTRIQLLTYNFILTFYIIVNNITMIVNFYTLVVILIFIVYFREYGIYYEKQF